MYERRKKTLEKLDRLPSVEYAPLHDMLQTTRPGTVARGYTGSLAGVAVLQGCIGETEGCAGTAVHFSQAAQYLPFGFTVSAEVGSLEKTLEGVRCPRRSRSPRLIASAQGVRVGRPRRR